MKGTINANQYHDRVPPNVPCRLRETDVRSGELERKVKALEAERDDWEWKFEEKSTKYSALQKELQDLELSMGNI